MRITATIALLLALAACGSKRDLRPAEGQALPPQPLTSPTRPDAAALMTPKPEQRPGRSDELLTRKERPDDRFELPPP